jgi:hypothetical protein
LLSVPVDAIAAVDEGTVDVPEATGDGDVEVPQPATNRMHRVIAKGVVFVRTASVLLVTVGA